MLSAFDDKGEYDYEANDKIIENLIKNEIDGIVILVAWRILHFL